MPYCSNCGIKVSESAKFCPECGVEVAARSMRQQVYDGTIHKCPSCGEALRPLDIKCPACGYELQERNLPQSVRELDARIRAADSNEQRADLVRGFPIPSTKGDIFEFMMLASSGISDTTNKDLSQTWMDKLDEAHQKASLLFDNDPDLDKIAAIYRRGAKKSASAKRSLFARKTIRSVLGNVGFIAGVILFLIAVAVDANRGNASMLELGAFLILVASAVSLSRANATVIDFTLGAICGLAIIPLSFLLRNNSLGQLCGVVVLVIVAINYIKHTKKRRQVKKLRNAHGHL